MNASGTLLLSGSKDNSNRLFDVRTIRPIQRFKGHQNTSKNFVKCSFAVGDSLIVGGSEDGIIYIWDATGNCVQTLRGHDGAVYSASFNAKQSLFVSGSDDNSVKTWHFDP